MTIYDILEKSITLGLEHDFRGKEGAKDFIWKEVIDSGDGRSFENVYPDTGVVNASSLLKEVKTAVVGIDIGTAEVLSLMTWSKSVGKTIDLFIGHHPEGRLNTSFPLMLYSHIGNLSACGVDVSHIQDKYDKLVEELQVDTLASNFTQIHDAVHYLGTNYISVHTPADNMGAQYVLKRLQEKEPSTLEDAVNALLEIEEYSYYRGVNNIVPIILSGEKGDGIGKYMLTEFTGGEEGPVESFMEMKLQGVSTIICMHMTNGGLDKCKEVGLNVISTGHMTSDSVGLNILCDTLEKEGIEIIPVSGFVRIPR